MDIDPFLQVPSFREARALFEKQFLRRKLTECRGNVSLLAEQVGLDRSNLYKKLRPMAWSRERKRGKRGKG